MQEPTKSISDIIRQHFRTSYLEIEKVVVLLNFIKKKREPEKWLSACLTYRTMNEKSNRRAMIERQFDLSRTVVYELCNECEKLKL